MPISRIPQRLARDFGIKPAESVVRHWIESAGRFSREIEIPAQVVKEFSGVLCVDEVYSGKLAVLLATDPNNADALIGMDLSDKHLDKSDVKSFFEKLKNIGIEPVQLVTDGSPLYPEVVKDVWPNVCHQLCLFHLNQKVTELAKKAVRDLKKVLPKHQNPAATRTHATKDDVITAMIMFKSGTPKREISRRLGISRNSLNKWLRDPEFLKRHYGIIIDALNSSGKNLPTNDFANNPPLDPVPEGWESWAQISEAEKNLSKLAFKISTRKKFYSEDIQALYKAVRQSPLKKDIEDIRAFIERWYQIWWQPNGEHVQDVNQAELYWSELASMRLEPSCQRFQGFQKRMNREKFLQLSTFFSKAGYQTTNNSAERYARKIKRIQKSRYRIRTKENLREFIKLDSLLKSTPLTFCELTNANIFALRAR